LIVILLTIFTDLYTR